MGLIYCRQVERAGPPMSGDHKLIWSNFITIDETKGEVMKKILSAAVFACTTGISGMLCAPAFAQGAPASSVDRDSTEDAASGSEIVVTARKREEALQSVPAAITAYTGEQLQRQSVVSLSDLQFVTAGLQLRTTASASGGSTVAIRGQVQNDTTLALDQSVGLYIDDVFIARDTGNAIDLLDVQNVQVLKGPQGTLFGRNTTGGAIVITRNKPGPDFGGYMRIGGGSNREIFGEAVLNVPLSTTLFARVAVQGRKDNGFGRSVETGGRNGVHDSRAIVGSLLWQPSSDVKLTLVGDFRTANDTTAAIRLLQVDPSGFGDLLLGGGMTAEFRRQQLLDNVHDTTSNLDNYQKTKTGGVALTADFDFGGITVKSVTSWRTLTLHSAFDLDTTKYDFSDTFYNITGYNQYTQEFTLNGSIGSALDWTLGAYYFNEKGRETDPFSSFNGTPFGFLIVTNAAVSTESLAGYAFVNYRVSDTIRLAGGVRYTKDWKEVVQSPTITSAGGSACYLALSAGGAPLSPCRRDTKADFSALTYTVSVDYKPDPNTLIYLTHRKGFRSGGINFRGSLPAEVVPYRPEEVFDFEAGAKNDFRVGGMPVRTNIAAFYDIYNGIQRTITLPGPNGGVVTNVINAATGRVYGGELEVTANPDPSLDIHIGLAAAIARYRKFDIAGVDQSKNRFFTPDFSGDVSVRYHLPIAEQLGMKDMVLGGRYYFQSKSALATVNLPSSNQRGYGLASARLDLIGLGGTALEVSLFVNNIFDKKYLQNSIDLTSLGWVTGTYGDPRTWGVRAYYKF